MLNYLDWQLAPEQQMIQGVVREFVEQEAMPLIPDCFEKGDFPRPLIPRLGELGVLGPTIPRYGAGLDYTSYGLICQELERGDSGLRSFVSVQGSLCMFPIASFGSDDQQQRYLPGMHRGQLIGCFGLTEHEHGSDPGSMETRAVKDGSDYVLNGGKMWITNGTIADVALIWAKVAEDGGADVIRGFLVETDTPGFSANEVKHKLSLRASVTSELVLHDVRVPVEAMLPGVKGLRGPLSCLSEARFGIIFGTVGAAMACYEAALAYSKLRHQWGRAIGGFQLTQEKLVHMVLELSKGGLLALHVGRMKDEGRVRPQHVSMGKLNNVRTALEIAREARGILGANGITLEYPVIRHMNNLESVFTYEGTNEVHTLTIGEAITGIGAFR